MPLFSLLRFAVFFGLAGSLRAIRFAIQRDRLDRRSLRKGDPEPRDPGAYKFGRTIAHGFEAHFERATLEIMFLAPEVVRITWQPGRLPIPYAISGNDWPGEQLEIKQEGEETSLKGSLLIIKIMASGAVEYSSADGNLLRREEMPVRSGDAWEQNASLDPLAHIFGLGERACGWDLRGGRYTLWNQDPGGSYGPGHDPLYMSIPLYTCLQPAGSYMLFYENAHRGELQFADQAHVQFKRGALRSYFFAGSPAHCLERYTHLTGRPPMPPRWALGYHQSRWGYRSQAEIQALAQRFKEHRLPISAIHLDIDYMDGYRVFTFNTKQFPAVSDLARDLQGDGIRLVTILDPGVKVDRGFPTYLDGLERRMYCMLPNGRPLLSVVWPGWVTFPDFTDPMVRTWWGSHYPQLLDKGIAGIWHDMNEPSSFAAWGDKTLPLPTMHTLESQGGDHLGAHNLYGLLMNRAGFEAIRDYRPEARPWLLSRSGYAGGQRYAWNWTGDVETSWEALRQTVATMLGVSLSGFAYTGSDIGGFSGSPGDELYLRWFQLGAFSPFFRTHSAKGTAPREPWMFDQTTLNAARRVMDMRCRLLAYLYTLAWDASQTGAPLMRPMFWSSPDEPHLWDIADQYYLGPDLLVAPVLEPEVRARQVYLPQGTWYDLWDHTRYQGPQLASIPVELDRIPVFVRGGSILPLLAKPEELELHLYPNSMESLSGMLYSDDGDGYSDHRVDHFSAHPGASSLKLLRNSEGLYPPPYRKLYLALHGEQINALSVGGKPVVLGDHLTEVPWFDEAEIEWSR